MRAEPPGGLLTGTAVGSEEAGFAEANPRSHAHLVRPAGILPLAQRCRPQDRYFRARWPPQVSHPTAGPPATQPPPWENHHPAYRSIPPAEPQHHCSVGIWGSLRCSTPLLPLVESCGASPNTQHHGGATQPRFGLHCLPSLTGRALPSLLLPAGAARRASGEPAGETRGPSVGRGVPGFTCGFMALVGVK